MTKKKPTIIKDTPKDALDNNNLQCSIITHVKTFGFCHIIENVIEAYREQARRYNEQADKLEKEFKRIA